MSLRPINAAQFRRTEQPHGEAPWVLDGIEIGHVHMLLYTTAQEV